MTPATAAWTASIVNETLMLLLGICGTAVILWGFSTIIFSGLSMHTPPYMGDPKLLGKSKKSPMRKLIVNLFLLGVGIEILYYLPQVFQLLIAKI